MLARVRAIERVFVRESEQQLKALQRVSIAKSLPAKTVNTRGVVWQPAAY